MYKLPGVNAPQGDAPRRRRRDASGAIEDLEWRADLRRRPPVVIEPSGGGGDDDLDPELRPGQPRLAAGPRRCVAVWNHWVPDGAHLVEVGSIGKPDHRLEE